MKSWVDRYLEWGLNRAENPWTYRTANTYRAILRALERDTGKPAEELDAEELRTYQAKHRRGPTSTWNTRHAAIAGFFQFLAAQGFFRQLTPEGLHRSDPSGVLTRRREERSGAPAPSVDVWNAIAAIPDPTYKQIALFLYHSGLKIGEATSITEPSVDGKLHVQRRRGIWEWVPVREEAIAVLDELGGQIPKSGRSIERVLPVKPSQIEAASRRDHQQRSSHGDALGPVWALLVGRQDLIQVAHAYRDAVEAMDAPTPRSKSAITAAARALQAMLVTMGAQGNSLGPLFQSARTRGLFGPYDSKLAQALDLLVDWVSADRVGRGDTHLDTEPGPEDAWLALRVVSALLLRLEVLSRELREQEARNDGELREDSARGPWE